MSDFRFGCPHCGQRIEGDAAYRGTQITCPACQKELTVPAPAAKVPIADLLKSAAATIKPEPPALSALALISLVCGFGLAAGSIPGILCGHLARKRIGRNPALRGNGLAVAGLILSYFSLVLSIGVFAVVLVGLGPPTGHQLSDRELTANTPAVLAARRVDEVKINDPESESDHGMKAAISRGSDFSGRKVRDALFGGFISYSLKVAPSRPMSLYCTYWGDDAGGRRFDILINDQVIATQTLQHNAPGRFFEVEYKLPEKLTRGQNAVTVTFQAYPRKTAGGLYGCQMLSR